MKMLVGQPCCEEPTVCRQHTNPECGHCGNCGRPRQVTLGIDMAFSGCLIGCPCHDGYSFRKATGIWTPPGVLVPTSAEQGGAK